jgi:hypothetical protein
MLEKAKYMSAPCPSIPSVQNPWTDFLQEEQVYTYIGLNNDVNQNQYRAMTAEEATREAYTYSQFSPLETQTVGEAQIGRDAHACSEPQTAREEQPAIDISGSKKSKRNNSPSMDELISLRREELLISLRREELIAYKDLTERELQLNKEN